MNIYPVQNIRYPNISEAIHLVQNIYIMGQFCGKLWAKNIHEISRDRRDHLSGTQYIYEVSRYLGHLRSQNTIWCKIHMKYQDISGTIYPVQVIGDHKKLMVAHSPRRAEQNQALGAFLIHPKHIYSHFVMPSYL